MFSQSGLLPVHILLYSLILKERLPTPNMEITILIGRNSISRKGIICFSYILHKKLIYLNAIFTTAQSGLYINS